MAIYERGRGVHRFRQHRCQPTLIDMYDVSVNAANYVVFKVARVCPIALINRSISAELIDLVGWIKLNSWSNPGLGVNPGLALIQVVRITL